MARNQTRTRSNLYISFLPTKMSRMFFRFVQAVIQDQIGSYSPTFREKKVRRWLNPDPCVFFSNPTSSNLVIRINLPKKTYFI